MELNFYDGFPTEYAIRLEDTLKILDDSHLQITLMKEFYNWETREFVLLDILITYEKAD